MELSYRCTFCHEWSHFLPKFPKTWKETDKGYQCPKCQPKKKKRVKK